SQNMNNHINAARKKQLYFNDTPTESAIRHTPTQPSTQMQKVHSHTIEFSNITVTKPFRAIV
ncbi:hypothetical protein, partial [Corynebacterium confusum]